MSKRLRGFSQMSRVGLSRSARCIPRRTTRASNGSLRSGRPRARSCTEARFFKDKHSAGHPNQTGTRANLSLSLSGWRMACAYEQQAALITSKIGPSFCAWPTARKAYGGGLADFFWVCFFLFSWGCLLAGVGGYGLGGKAPPPTASRSTQPEAPPP